MKTYTTFACDDYGGQIEKDAYLPEEVARLIKRSIRTVYDRAKLLHETIPYIFRRPPRSSGEFTSEQVSLIKQADQLIRQKKVKGTKTYLKENGLLP
jgi:hypothetical protein